MKFLGLLFLIFGSSLALADVSLVSGEVRVIGGQRVSCNSSNGPTHKGLFCDGIHLTNSEGVRLAFSANCQELIPKD